MRRETGRVEASLKRVESAVLYDTEGLWRFPALAVEPSRLDLPVNERSERFGGGRPPQGTVR
jgi:hypothetical protein